MAKRRSGSSQAGSRAVGASKTGDTESRPAGRGSGDCVYAGQEYSEGAIIDQGGVQQRCVNGKWQIVDPAHRGRVGLPPNA
jgi:hypothetical protein